jgi:hypothetical protein
MKGSPVNADELVKLEYLVAAILAAGTLKEGADASAAIAKYREALIAIRRAGSGGVLQNDVKRE